MHRDTALMFGGLIIAVAFGALLLNYGNTREPQPLAEQPAAVSFSVLFDGQEAAEIRERVNYRIRTEAEFSVLWEAIHEDDDMPLPFVDFDAHDVLAVFEGERPTGGYDISVVSVMTTEKGELEVTILHEEPGATCLTTSVITAPFELVVVPKSDAKITREDLVDIKECE